MKYSEPSKIRSSIKTLTKEESLKRYKKIKKAVFYNDFMFAFFMLFPWIPGVGVIHAAAAQNLIIPVFYLAGGALIGLIGKVILDTKMSSEITETKLLKQSPGLLIDQNNKKQNPQTIVNLPIFQETLKDIYQKDQEFFRQYKHYFFKKENTENKKVIKDHYENYELFIENLNLEKEKYEILFSSLILKLRDSKDDEDYLFQSTFEIFEDRKTKEKYLNSVEFNNPDILKNTDLEKLDLRIASILENAYRQYEENKNAEAVQKVISYEKQQENLNDFVKTIDNTPENCLQKCIDFSLIKDEIKVLKTLNTTDISQKI